MKFSTVLSLACGAQAASIMNLLPAAFTESLELMFGEPQAESAYKVPVPGNSPLELCEAGRPQLFNVTNVTLTPALPVAGENLTIDATGLLLTNVTAGAYVDVIVKYGLINVIKARYDLCTYLPEVGYECPTGPGEVTISKSVEMPATLPVGEYLVIAKAYTVEEDLLSCLFADVTLGL